MPPKCKVSGGPLRRRIERAAGIRDTLAVIEVMNSLRAKARSPEQQLAAIIADIRAELKGNGIEDADPNAVLEVVERLGFEHPAREFYLAESLKTADLIQRLVAKDPWSAVRLAIQLGGLLVEMELESADKQAAGNERRGKQGVATRRTQAAKWIARARTLAKDIWGKNSNHTTNNVARMIREKLALDRSPRSVQQAIADLRPKKVRSDY